MIKLVIFDVWNTLLSLKDLYNMLAENLAIMLGIDKKKAWSMLSSTANNIRERRKLGEKISVEASLEIFERENNVDKEILRRVLSEVFDKAKGLALPDALSTLKTLKQRGYKIAVLGNTIYWPGWFTRLLLSREGLYKYIDKTFFSDETGFSKPAPEAFLNVIKVFKVEPREAVHVGDRADEDFSGALIAGLHAILISKDIQTPLRIHRRAFIVASLSQVVDVLATIK